MRMTTAAVATLTALTTSLLPAADAEASTAVPHVLVSGAVGSSRQVVLVSSTTTSATTARVSLWLRGSDGRWRQARPPVSAWVGVHGMTTSKREGDGRTPVGIFPAGLGFGWYANPGTKLSWRTADSNSRWVDDSGSPYYNRWMQAPANGRWDSAERLRITPYMYALQIGYNLARRPGLGSAIFFHLSAGHATSGCVSTDKTTVVSTLKWLDPTLHPTFVIGTQYWIAHH